MYKLLLLGLFSIILLNGCYSLSDKKDIPKISTLNIIKDELTSSIIWKISVGDRTDNFYSSLHPACSNNIVYIANRSGIVKGININNGKEIWTVNLVKKNKLFSQNSVLLSGGITVFGDHIYVGSEKAQVYALDIKDGSVIWQTTVAGEVLSSPIVSDKIVLIHTSNGQLQALYVTNGAIKWTVNLGVSIFSLRGESSPAITDSGIIIVGSNNGLISAILLQDGRIIWQQYISQVIGRTEVDCLNDIDATPIIVDNTVYAVAYNGSFVALDLFNGDVIWKRNLGSVHNFTIHNDYIYFSDQNDRIMAISAKNGATIWVQNSLMHRLLTAPVLHNKSLIVGDSKGYIYWLDSQNGSFIYWKRINSSGFSIDPIVANDKILIQSKDNVLYAIINSCSNRDV